jgi:cadmium resistance protein CadD (predicted permease)
LPGFFGGLILPRPWIGLFGLVPIIIGIKSLMNRETDELEDSSIFCIDKRSFLFTSC